MILAIKLQKLLRQ